MKPVIADYEQVKGEAKDRNKPTHYEFWVMGGSQEVAEKLKYFLIGFLNLPHLA